MGLTTTIKAPFVSSSTRTAVNAALTTAGLPTFADNFFTKRELAARYSQMPVLAAEVTKVDLVTRLGGGLGRYRAEVTIYLLLGGPDYASLLANLETYIDVVRGAFETNVTGFEFVQCTGYDGEGEPVDENTREAALTFTVETFHTIGTA